MKITLSSEFKLVGDVDKRSEYSFAFGYMVLRSISAHMADDVVGALRKLLDGEGQVVLLTKYY
jgi:hypothetical protein